MVGTSRILASMDPEIPTSDYREIEKLIASDDSPVGIDAKKTLYGFIIQPNCKSHCVKRWGLLAAGHLWPESATQAMGCGDEIHTVFKLLTHHDIGL